MKKSLTLLLVTVSTLAVADLKSELSFALDHHRTWVPVIARPIGQIKNIAGRGFNLDVHALATSDAAFGFSISKPFNIADNVALRLGVWGRFEPNKPNSAGPFAGISFQF